jgi:amidase
MDERKVDVLVYPSWNNPPRLIGDLNSPHGNNSPRISPPTGFPAITDLDLDTLAAIEPPSGYGRD